MGKSRGKAVSRFRVPRIPSRTQDHPFSLFFRISVRFILWMGASWLQWSQMLFPAITISRGERESRSTYSWISFLEERELFSKNPWYWVFFICASGPCSGGRFICSMWHSLTESLGGHSMVFIEFDLVWRVQDGPTHMPGTLVDMVGRLRLTGHSPSPRDLSSKTIGILLMAAQAMFRASIPRDKTWRLTAF